MTLRLFQVKDTDRWGYSDNIVWAEDEEQAKKLVAPQSKSITVTELKVLEEPGIIWCHDESPDT